MMRSLTRPWAFAYALALIAVLATLGLAGSSAWLLGLVISNDLGPLVLAAAVALPMAVIRICALLRTGARYAERYVGHKAAIEDQISHRCALYDDFSTDVGTLAEGWQLQKSARLTDFMDDVEAVEYDRLRTGMPVGAAAVAGAILAAATLVVAPWALLALLPLAVFFACLPRLARRLAARELRQRRLIRQGSSALGAVHSAAAPLTIENRRRTAVEHALGSFQAVEALRHSQMRLQGWAEAILAHLGPILAAAVLLAAVLSGSQGADTLPALVLAFAWLSGGELALPLPRAALARVSARAARHSLRQHQSDDPRRDRACIPFKVPNRLGRIRINGVVPMAPSGARLHAPIYFTARPGHAVAITGSSGCGKTLFLKQLAGWLPGPSSTLLADGQPMDSADRQAFIHLCLHDAVILSDTWRANLFGEADCDEVIWTALDTVELSSLVRARGGLDAWITQDALSLGEAQRLNLARALVSQKPVLLFDEPWEHLASEQARRIAAAILAGAPDKCILFSTHKAMDGASLHVCFDDQPATFREQRQTSKESRAAPRPQNA